MAWLLSTVKKMINNKNLKISCVMVTKDRLPFIKSAIKCFTKQTYKNKELVVLCHGSDQTINAIKKYIENFDEDIKLITIKGNLSCGFLKNLIVELSTGNIICNWDDGDLYHPIRLTTQLCAILSENSIGSAYTQYLKYFKKDGCIYWVDIDCRERTFVRFLEKSIMFYKDFFHKHVNFIYPETDDQVEDESVIKKLLDDGKISSIEKGFQYVCVDHGELFDLENNKLYGKSKLLENEDILKKTFNLVSISEPVEVCYFRSSDKEVAFCFDVKN